MYQIFYTRIASNQNVMYLKVRQHTNKLTHNYKCKKQTTKLAHVKLNSPFEDQKENATTKMLANHR